MFGSVLVIMGCPEAATDLLTAAGSLAYLISAKRITALAMCSPLSATAMQVEGTLTEEAIYHLVSEEQQRLSGLRTAYEGGQAQELLKGSRHSLSSLPHRRRKR